MAFRGLTILGLLVLGIGGWPDNARAQDPPRIELVFRYDDFSSRSPGKLEDRLFRLFADRKISLTVGITPFIVSGSVEDYRPQPLLALSEEKFHLLEAGLAMGFLEPALHGYSHQTNRYEGKAPSSEFIGLSFDEQYRRIEEGKRFLASRLGKTLDIFIPPWNLYDENTVRCLEKLDFHVLSDQLFGRAIPSASLFFLPETAAISSLADSIRGARKAAPDDSLVILLIHPNDFIEADGERGYATLDGLSSLLDWVLDQKDIHPTSMRELTARKTFNASLRAANIKYLCARNLLPAVIFRRLNFGWGAVFSSAYLSRIRFKLWFYITTYSLIILGLGSLIVFLFGSGFLARWPGPGRPGLLLALMILAFSAALTLSNLTLTYRKLLLLLLSLGFLAGLWAACHRIENLRRGV